jgi:hypothetical protein
MWSRAQPKQARKADHQPGYSEDRDDDQRFHGRETSAPGRTLNLRLGPVLGGVVLARSHGADAARPDSCLVVVRPASSAIFDPPQDDIKTLKGSWAFGANRCSRGPTS